MQEIQDFVLRYPNIETGGDLFGLWRANGDPVVQLLIGPGENCRRTAVSFHQDTNYLARVGRYVNSHLMLCHIGSWHSHHQLSLTQPSGGDRSTVCNNYPEGLKQYIMIIVNITRGTSGRQSVVLHPYMFTKGGHVCQQGKVEKISSKNPFRQDGSIMAIIGYGAEHSLAKDAYASRAPLEYQHRPSTQSKHISANRKSHSPVKADKNYNQPSTLSRISPDQPTPSNPIHQNYFRKSDAADRDSPMEVDEPENYRGVQSEREVAKNHYNRNCENKSLKHFKDKNIMTQWYETEEGGTKLKEIIEEITTTMNTNISYNRDLHFKNLIMVFPHRGKDWTIHFPGSFDNEPAIIVNPIDGKNLSSKNVVKDIRRHCKCHACRACEDGVHERSSRKGNGLSSPKRNHSLTHEKQNRQLSQSNDLHYSSSPKRSSPNRHDHLSPNSYGRSQKSQMKSRSSPQPWYNRESGKRIVERVKSDIETYLKTSSTNAGGVKTKEIITSKGRVKQLHFYHYGNWIIEFVGSSQDVEVKTEKFGQIRCVAKLSSPYDVLSELKKQCVCSHCRSRRRSPSAGQRRTRPNSRYADIPQRSPVRVASTPTPRHFESDDGEKKFMKIYNEIHAFLDSGPIEMARGLYSKGINVIFVHNRKQWNVKFPFKFPRELPKVSCNNSYPEAIRGGHVIRRIREICMCQSCKRYPPFRVSDV